MSIIVIPRYTGILQLMNIGKSIYKKVLIVYYEVPAEGKREEVKRKFNDFVLSITTRSN